MSQPERIAVFDNDGTLWSEQPMYFQAAFVVDRVRALAPRHPEWKSTEAFASVLGGDVTSALAGGEHALLEMARATHAGTTTEEDGDLPMLQWTAAGSGARVCLYVRHTDESRERAHDRQSSIGRLDKGLDEAHARGWTVVDMKKDWSLIHPFEKR